MKLINWKEVRFFIYMIFIKKKIRRQSVFMENLAECIVFANHKGGTGKTTSCLSIVGFLGKAGRKVDRFEVKEKAKCLY
jgi:hypothetical protein